MSERLQNEGNTGSNKVLAMKPGLSKIIEKVSISMKFGCPETALHIAANTCSIDYTDTRWSKQVHWLSKSVCTNPSTFYYGCEITVEFNTGVVWANLLLTRIQPQATHASMIQWSPATHHITGWIHHCQIRNWILKAILILDHVDIDKVYGIPPSHHNCVQ